jgi:hypothetical protein
MAIAGRFAASSEAEIAKILSEIRVITKLPNSHKTFYEIRSQMFVQYMDLKLYHLLSIVNISGHHHLAENNWGC